MPRKTNFKKIHSKEKKTSIAKSVEENMGVEVSANEVLALESDKGLILFYERNDDKGKRNRASFYTLDTETGEREDLFCNPLAVQEIDNYSIFF